MLYNVYRIHPDNRRELCFKEQHRADVLEYITGKTVGDTLPVILPDEVAHIYYSMRLMEPGETMTCEEYVIEKL